MWLNETYDGMEDAMYHHSWPICFQEWLAGEVAAQMIGLYGERVICLITEITILEALEDQCY
jgi:hypothetical protein